MSRFFSILHIFISITAFCQVEQNLYLPITYFPEVTFCYSKSDSLIMNKIEDDFERVVYATENFKTLPHILKNQYDTSIVKRYSRVLSRFEEPILYDNDQIVEVYRFLWLRSFHNPMVFRIEKNKNYYLIRKGLDLRAKPQTIYINDTIILSNSDAKKLNSKILKMNFFKMNNNVLKGTVDGSRWVIEIKNSNQYNAVARFSPKNSELYELGKYILNLSQLEFTNQELY